MSTHEDDADSSEEQNVENEQMAGAALSKNQQKKRKREEYLRNKKIEKKAFIKQKKQESRLAAEEAAARGEPVVPLELPADHVPRRNGRSKNCTEHYLTSYENSFSVIIDCNWESIHKESALKSLTNQINYCYGANRKHSHPCKLFVTGMGPRLTERMTMMNYANWTGVTFSHEEYIANTTDFCRTPSTSSGAPEAVGEEGSSKKKQPKQLIYLTADSEHLLETLEPDCAYVIGGIVDRNSAKGQTLAKAQAEGVRTGRLPIKENFALNTSQVLTVNHVFEILLNYTATRSWAEAIEMVLPKRKVVGPGDEEGGAGAAEGEEATAAAAEDVQNEEPEQSDVHGESVWNITDPDRGLVSRFTGWADVALTERGKIQAEAAGRCLKMFGVYPDAVFTSRLKRSINSFEMMRKNDPDMFDVQVAHSWRLNERHYGGLVGLSKEEAGVRFGHNIAMGWRRSWDQRPPEVKQNTFEWSQAEWGKPITTLHETGKPALVFIEKGVTMPKTESLQDCALRVKPIWVNFIAPKVVAGETVLVVAHANSIRSMIKHIDEATMSIENLKNVHIPSATPLVYCFTTKDPSVASSSSGSGGGVTPSSSSNAGSVSTVGATSVSARSIRPMGLPSKLGMTGRYLVNKEVIKLALESSVSMDRKSRENPDNIEFFDLIDKNLDELVKYATTGNGKDEALMITDGRGNILHVNHTFENQTGYHNEEVLGKTARFLKGPLTQRENLTALDEKLQTGLPATSTFINYHRDGSAFENNMTIIPIFDWLPTIKGNVCTVLLPTKVPIQRGEGGQHLLNRQSEDENFRTTSGQYMHPSHFICRYNILSRPDLVPLNSTQMSERNKYLM